MSGKVAYSLVIVRCMSKALELRAVHPFSLLKHALKRFFTTHVFLNGIEDPI